MGDEDAQGGGLPPSGHIINPSARTTLSEKEGHSPLGEPFCHSTTFSSTSLPALLSLHFSLCTRKRSRYLRTDSGKSTQHTSQATMLLLTTFTYGERLPSSNLQAANRSVLRGRGKQGIKWAVDNRPLLLTCPVWLERCLIIEALRHRKCHHMTNNGFQPVPQTLHQLTTPNSSQDKGQ